MEIVREFQYQISDDIGIATFSNGIVDIWHNDNFEGGVTLTRDELIKILGIMLKEIREEDEEKLFLQQVENNIFTGGL